LNSFSQFRFFDHACNLKLATSFLMGNKLYIFWKLCQAFLGFPNCLKENVTRSMNEKGSLTQAKSPNGGR